MKYIVLLSILLITGCLHTKSGSNYPPDIKDLCIRAKTQAKIDIESYGRPLTKDPGVAVVKMPGVEKIKGRWAYKDQVSGMLIYGNYLGWRLEVGCNPNTMGEVDYDILYHEYWHYWIQTNFKEFGHPAKYDRTMKWSWIDDYLKEAK